MEYINVAIIVLLLIGYAIGIIAYYKSRTHPVVTKKTRRKPLDRDVRTYVIARDKVCQNCKRDDCCSWHIDHILPLALGGTENLDNLQLLCAHCNLTKGAYHPLTFKKEHGIIKELQ